jgi:hypothetical protein
MVASCSPIEVSMKAAYTRGYSPTSKPWSISATNIGPETALPMHVKVIMPIKMSSRTSSTKVYVVIADPNQPCLASIADFGHLRSQLIHLAVVPVPTYPSNTPASMETSAKMTPQQDEDLRI